jgi:dCTP diphosphatase
VSNATTTLAELTELIRQFTREREWEPFHHPKDLGVALAIEVGEILEHFRYRTNEQIHDYLQVPSSKRELSHELADGMWLLLRLADVCDVDLADAMKEKLLLAAEKYPADLVRGKPDKYTAYHKQSPPSCEPTP